jgi:hypothetical protein
LLDARQALVKSTDLLEQAVAEIDLTVNLRLKAGSPQCAAQRPRKVLGQDRRCLGTVEIAQARLSAEQLGSFGDALGG